MRNRRFLIQQFLCENPERLVDGKISINTGLFKRNVWARGCLFKRLIEVFDIHKMASGVGGDMFLINALFLLSFPFMRLFWLIYL